MTRVIPIRDYLIYNGMNSLDYKVRISGNGTYRAAERDIESVVVPGRNGELTIDRNRFKNSQQTYDAYIVDGYQENLSAFMNGLLSSAGYSRLEDSYHLDEFRMARFLGPVDPESVMDEAGRFELVFDCKPQRYLKQGEEEITIGPSETKVLFNPSPMTALPRIVVTSGTGDIVVNMQHCTLTANNGATVIDSELMDCYEGTVNRSGSLTLSDGYPRLIAGENSISVPAGMTIKIQPRWWKL